MKANSILGKINGMGNKILLQIVLEVFSTFLKRFSTDQAFISPNFVPCQTIN